MVVLSGQGGRLAFCSDDPTMLMWNTLTEQIKRVPAEYSKTVSSLAILQYESLATDRCANGG
jgi:hypothetical protein